MGMFDDLHKLDKAEQGRNTQRRRVRASRSATSTRASRKEPAPDATSSRPTHDAAAVSPIDHRPDTVTAPQPSTELPKVAAIEAPEVTPPHTASTVQPSDTDGFDLTQMPYRKFTCLLTPDEHRDLDLLKIELVHRLDGAITKENLARCAIHYMVADFRQRGEASPVLAPLLSKAGSR